MDPNTAEYIRDYVDMYRKDLIDRESLLLSLVDIGVKPNIAQDVCYHEVVRREKLRRITNSKPE